MTQNQNGSVIVSLAASGTIIAATVGFLWEAHTPLYPWAMLMCMINLALLFIVPCGKTITVCGRRLPGLYASDAVWWMVCRAALTIGQYLATTSYFRNTQTKACLVGSYCEGGTEPWTFTDTFYFTAVTATTVGFGDFSPAPDFRGDGILHMLVGLHEFGVLMLVLDRIVSASRERNLDQKNRQALQKHRRVPQSDEHGVLKAKAFTLLSLWMGFGVIHTLSALIFMKLEGWSFQTSLYYCITTATSVGYGDVTCATQAGRQFATFHVLFSVVMFSIALGQVVRAFGQYEAIRNRRIALKRPLDAEYFRALDLDGKDGVSRLEFLVGTMSNLGMLNISDVRMVLAQFDQLDKDGSGVLDEKDIDDLVTRLREDMLGRDESTCASSSRTVEESSKNTERSRRATPAVPRRNVHGAQSESSTSMSGFSGGITMGLPAFMSYNVSSPTPSLHDVESPVSATRARSVSSGTTQSYQVVGMAAAVRAGIAACPLQGVVMIVEFYAYGQTDALLQALLVVLAVAPTIFLHSVGSRGNQRLIIVSFVFIVLAIVFGILVALSSYMLAITDEDGYLSMQYARDFVTTFRFSSSPELDRLVTAPPGWFASWFLAGLLQSVQLAILANFAVHLVKMYFGNNMVIAMTGALRRGSAQFTIHLRRLSLGIVHNTQSVSTNVASPPLDAC